MSGESSSMQSADPATSGIQTPETEVGSVFVSNYPPFSVWSGDNVPHFTEQLHREIDDPLGLYIHIPFCRKRCKFCYFKIYTDKNAEQIERYVDAVLRETEQLASYPGVGGRPLKFVYFGGGTPSYIAVKHLRKLVQGIQGLLPWDAIEEITFECEPGTLTQPKLEAIRELGITRLSLGVENFDDEILRVNGRAHISTEIDRVLPWIEELDFPQLNIDLIAGMVGENWITWKETVKRTVALAPEAVTIYQMELPHNAVFSRELTDGGSGHEFADWQTKRDWQQYAYAELEAAGYETSSAYTMVRKDAGAQFLYRDALWHGHDLLGVGVSSFGHLQGVHYQNSASWGSYMERVENDEPVVTRAYATTPDDRLIREFILQLKLGELDAGYFQSKFSVDAIERFRPALEQLAKEKMLSFTADTVTLTRQGLLRVDSLLPNFYDPAYKGARYT